MLLQRMNKIVLFGPFLGLQVPKIVLDQDLMKKLLDHLHKKITINWNYSHRQRDKRQNVRKRKWSHQNLYPSQTAPNH